jgi:RNA polymerase sigma-70 factor, ECF subfamily
MASPRKSTELRTLGRDGAALFKRIAGGDESALITLYDTTCGLIYGLLLRILGSSEVAEQVLVAVYQEVWEQASTYDDEHEKPMTKLITMARRRAIVRLRADSQDQERQACLLKITERTLTANPKTDGTISDPQRIVRSAFAALPPLQQQIIELAYFSGLRHNQIAARLGLSLQSVQKGMRAGMITLCDAFESHQLYLV